MRELGTVYVFSEWHPITWKTPLTRGEVESLAIIAVIDRIIPAYAGKRLLPCNSAKSARDHPRLRGEKIS